MSAKDIVERGTILRATVGSTVHGLHHGGQDDSDEMAVFIEPPEFLLGLARAKGIRGGLYGFEHFVDRTQPEGMRSGPGDLDLVAYSLRKYVRLALKGHPTILLLLFVPNESILVQNEIGEELRELRPSILSQRAGRGYLGYLGGQKERLMGVRGQKRVNRPELVGAHGYDTKYAMHAARLGYQGIELLENGFVTLPMPEPERSRVMAIRTGERSFAEAVAEIDEVETRLKDALARYSSSGDARQHGGRSLPRPCISAWLGPLARALLRERRTDVCAARGDREARRAAPQRGSLPCLIARPTQPLVADSSATRSREEPRDGHAVLALAPTSARCSICRASTGARSSTSTSRTRRSERSGSIRTATTTRARTVR